MFSTTRVWSSQGIPGPTAWVPLRELYHVLRPNAHMLDFRRIREYGKIVGYHDGDTACLVVADPEMLKEMLVRNLTSFQDIRRTPAFDHQVYRKWLTQLCGDEWRQTRSIITPTFSSGKLKSMFPLIIAAIDTMIERIDASSKTSFDIKDLFARASMDIIGRCAFAVETSKNDEFFHHARNVFKFKFWKMIIARFSPDFLKRRLTLAPVEHTIFLAELAQSILNMRRSMMRQGQQVNHYSDFMQLMIDASLQEPNGDNTSSKSSECETKRLTDEEIVSNSVLFLLAGFETTASAMTYIAYCLACFPEIQDKCIQEIDSIGELTYDNSSQLFYLEAVINESLRMYPPVTRVDRQVSDKKGFTFDCHLGSVHMPHKSLLIVPIYAIHHMEEYWPEPEKFDPQRFMPENKDKIVPYSFLPFVTGPRNCLGIRFAQVEAKLTIACLLQNHRFVRTDETDIPLDLSGSFYFLGAKRVSLGIQKRA